MESAASQARDTLIYNYVDVAASSILYFDMLITLADEVNFIWKRPKSFSAVAFMLNRYLLSSGTVVTTIWHAHLNEVCNLDTPSQCNKLREVLVLLAQVIVILLLTMRTYALYGRNSRILALLVCLALVFFAVAIWSAISLASSKADPMTVVLDVTVSWWMMFIFDSTVFTLTCLKTYRGRFAHQLQGNMTVTALMFRDGAVYYAVMALTNLANILTYYLANSILLRGVLTAFSNCLSVTLISRLVLNLHKTAHSGILHNSDLQASAASGTMPFRTSFRPPQAPLAQERSIISRRTSCRLTESPPRYRILPSVFSIITEPSTV
ncbi:hypothetical protein PLICRDRAFT_39043 [Plicaturopsis crispa FD-325 SS-3]|nr:hypothetical protein PLICRDRAFT_39043 [Plicaturopsis crispa FD-325 SS-3]